MIDVIADFVRIGLFVFGAVIVLTWIIMACIKIKQIWKTNQNKQQKRVFMNK